ncbi:MAG: hypothetical protein ACKO5K_02640 [Armatimonadota bacterium]
MRIQPRFLLLAALFAALLAVGCSKGDGGAGTASAGGDMMAPGATPSQAQRDAMRAQRMPPQGAGGGRPMGAPMGAPGAPTTR